MSVDLDKLEELAREATPGPWTYDPNDEDNYTLSVRFGDKEVAHLSTIDSDKASEDAAFIAAANPAIVLELVQRVRAAEAIVRDLAAKEPRVVLETPMGNGDRYQCALCGAWNRDGGAIGHLTGCSYRRAVVATKP